MEAELKSLEQKLNRFIELCHRMRVANEQLRQQLASAVNENKQLVAKIGTATARLPLMGVRRRFQNGPLGAALALGVIDRVRRFHAARGTRWGELSWVLEDNARVRRIIEMLGAAPYKTYRMYEKELT